MNYEHVQLFKAHGHESSQEISSGHCPLPKGGETRGRASRKEAGGVDDGDQTHDNRNHNPALPTEPNPAGNQLLTQRFLRTNPLAGIRLFRLGWSP